MAHVEMYNQFCNLDTLLEAINDDAAITTALVDPKLQSNQAEAKTYIHFESAISGAEKTALDAIIAAHQPGSGQFGQENFHVITEDAEGIQKEEWFATDNGDGTYSDKVKEILYSYVQGKLTQRKERRFFTDGVMAIQEKFKYYENTELGTRIIKRA